MDVRKQIRLYLEDEEALYKEWYRKQIEHDTGESAEPMGGLDDIKKWCINWVETHKLALRQRVCPKISAINAAKKRIDMIVAVTGLVKDLAFVGAAVEVATHLVFYGLEKLCGTNET